MSDHGHPELDEAHARLQALEERIERLEGSLDAKPKGPEYYESGTVNPDLDDQSIAP